MEERVGTVKERRLRCVFEGGRAGAGAATWGQRAIWEAVRALAPEDAARYNVRGGGAVTPGYTASRIVEALGLLLLRHESLRTHISPNGEGVLRQTLFGAGELPVTVVECAADEVEPQAAALLERVSADPFDAASDWPIRVGIIESGGTARHLALAVAHTAVDGWGLRHLVLDLAELTENGGSEDAQGRLQPLDEAAFQTSPRGRRQDAKARAYWLAKAEQGPRQLLPVRAELPAGALFPNALLDSPALARAVPLLSEQLAASPATILLAAAAATVSRLGGSPEVLFQVVVNNRFQPGLDRAVSTVAQEGLFNITVTDAPFSDLVRRAVGASLATYRHAYYDKTLLDAELAELRGSEAGAADLTCFVNDTRGLMPSPETPQAAAAEVLARANGSEIAKAVDAVDSPEELDRLRARTELRWPVEFPPREQVSFALDAVDLPGSLGLTMTADPSRLPRPEMEQLLRGIEDCVVEEALRAFVTDH
jgi:Condensation domain